MLDAKKVYDLTRTIDSEHFRWHINLETSIEEMTGRKFTTSRLALTSHCFTHIDAFRHTIPEAESIDTMPIYGFIGEGYVADLSFKEKNEEVTARDLKKFEKKIKDSEILILSTQWDSKINFNAKEFWEYAPYVSYEAAEWIISKKLKAVGYDFPQDYEIRGHENPLSNNDTTWPLHELLPSHKIYQIEYLKIPKEVLSHRVRIVALPLKLKNVDGSPARVICYLK
jgi:kynurenine formamidase